MFWKEETLLSSTPHGSLPKGDLPVTAPDPVVYCSDLYLGRSASQNAISVDFDARFERFGLCFPTIKIARANAARGANDPRYLVLLLTFPHHTVMTGQTRGSNQPNQRKSLIFKSEINGFGSKYVSFC